MLFRFPPNLTAFFLFVPWFTEYGCFPFQVNVLVSFDTLRVAIWI